MTFSIQAFAGVLVTVLFQVCIFSTHMEQGEGLGKRITGLVLIWAGLVMPITYGTIWLLFFTIWMLLFFGILFVRKHFQATYREAVRTRHLMDALQRQDIPLPKFRWLRFFLDDLQIRFWVWRRDRANRRKLKTKC